MADEFIAEAPTEGDPSERIPQLLDRSWRPIAARSSTPDWSCGWQHVRMRT